MEMIQIGKNQIEKNQIEKKIEKRLNKLKKLKSSSAKTQEEIICIEISLDLINKHHVKNQVYHNNKQYKRDHKRELKPILNDINELLSRETGNCRICKTHCKYNIYRDALDDKCKYCGWCEAFPESHASHSCQYIDFHY